jgi:hypothetical protein
MLDITVFNVDCFLKEIHMFFNSAEGAYLEKRVPISMLKNLSCKKYSFKNY